MERWDVEEEEEMEDSETVARTRLLRVRREAPFVEHLVCDLKKGRVNPWELPTILENLGTRLAKLAGPANSRRDVSQGSDESR
jgi:hypothetical protein